MTIHLRADRAVFRFSGVDAHKLLNDVVTGHVPAQDQDVAAWWALLSPQGKILAEGLVGSTQVALWVDVHQSVADDFFKRMRMYRLRAQVVIDDLRLTHRVGWSAEGGDGPVAHADRRGPLDLGRRIIAPVEATENWIADDAPHARARIAAGIAELGQDFSADSTFAHDMGMDILDGIDFVKGCYVGQEVVSRMKHRGTARRRPVIISGLQATGEVDVSADGRASGGIGRVVDGAAVGIVRLDRFGPDAVVTVGGQPVHLRLPDWATYEFGEPATEDAPAAPV